MAQPKQVGQSPKGVQIILWIVGAVVLLAAGGVGGYLLHRSLNNNSSKNSHIAVANTNSVAVSNVNTNAVAVNTNAANTNTAVVTTVGRTLDGTMEWHGLQEIPSLHVFKTPSQTSYNFDYEKGIEVNPNAPNSSGTTPAHPAHYYNIGTYISGPHKGDDIVLVSSWDEGPVQFPTYDRFLKTGTKLQLLHTYQPPTNEQTKISETNYNPSVVTAFNTTLDIPDLDYPTSLTTLDGQFALARVEYINVPFSTDNLRALYVDPTYGTAYTSIDPNPVPNSKGSVVGQQQNIFHSNAIFFKKPDGTMALYSPTPNFIVKGAESSQYGQLEIPNITWNAGGTNADGYSWTSLTGCGANNYLGVLKDESINPETDFVQTGVTSKGNAIFEFKNTDHQFLKDYYANNYTPTYGQSASTKESYALFVTHHPVIFYQDGYGRWIKMQNVKYQLQAECGKPVIYLYPTTTTDVDVTLKPAGGFTYTEPAYGAGWHVVATPGGKMTNLADGKTYPYLFWEGRGGYYAPPTKGWVVAQKDVHTFLDTKLAQLGLNEKETADFQEFWEPRMQGSSWYFVSFYGNSTMDQLAPLHIIPQPDTVIRVLMDFQPLAHPISVPGYTITTPTRKGFTVVEWGGVIR